MFRPMSTALLLALASPATAGGFDSLSTRFDYASCPEAPSPEPGIIEVHRCTGPGGIPVTFTGEPDASFVTFGTRPIDESPDLGSFFEAGGTAEWRIGPTGGKPFAAIIRYDYGPNIGTLDRSRLVVYRLEGSGRSCIMGSVDGHAADANAKARRLADQHAERFVCGVSRRL